MAIPENIKAAYASVKNYPDLASKLINAGAQSYTVDVASGTTLYRLMDGSIHFNTNTNEPREIAKKFDEALTIQAIRDNQQGKTDYPGFMNGIAKAGVRFYEASLNPNKSIIYIGSGGFYEEAIPI
jgi:uncharacterized protein YbcV (DUF1398 family)